VNSYEANSVLCVLHMNMKAIRCVFSVWKAA